MPPRGPVFRGAVYGRQGCCPSLAAGPGNLAGTLTQMTDGDGQATFADLQVDVEALTEGFRQGKRVGLMLRNERADRIYTTGFIHALFEKEGGDLFDVREAVLGHVQQGGDPSPFDRIQATRLAARCMEYLIDQADRDEPGSAVIGLQAGKVRFTDLGDLPDLVEPGVQRPARQRWLSLRPLASVMAAPRR